MRNLVGWAQNNNLQEGRQQARCERADRAGEAWSEADRSEADRPEVEPAQVDLAQQDRVQPDRSKTDHLTSDRAQPIPSGRGQPSRSQPPHFLPHPPQSLRHPTLLFILALLLATLGCARSAQIRSTPSSLPPPPQGVVPSGTLAVAQLQQPLSTSSSKQGDRFSVELLDPLVDSEGEEQVAKGAIVEGVVQNARSSPVAGRKAALELGVLGLRSKGERLIPVQAEIASSPIALDSAFGSSALGFVVGAAVGAGVGLAIDTKSAPVVIGATVIGACAASLGTWLFARRHAQLPAGSIVTLRLTENFNLGELSAKGKPRALDRASGSVEDSDSDSDSDPGSGTGADSDLRSGSDSGLRPGSRPGSAPSSVPDSASKLASDPAPGIQSAPKQSGSPRSDSVQRGSKRASPAP